MSTALPNDTCVKIGQTTTFFPPNRTVPQQDVQSFFLAGSIDQGKAPEWQLEATERVADKPVHIFNPRRRDWDQNLEQSIDSEGFVEQVIWELERLDDVKVIAMYLAPNSHSPISMLELGTHLKSGKMVVGCDSEYLWHKYVEEYCRHNMDTCQHVASLEDLIGKVEAIPFTPPSDDKKNIEASAAPGETAPVKNAMQHPPTAIGKGLPNTLIGGHVDAHGDRIMVFLGGSVFVRSENDWRAQLTEKINPFGIDLYTPILARSDEMSSEEIECKINAIEKSDLTVVYLKKDPVHPNGVDPASLLELGALLKSGKVIVACEEDYPRQANVVLTCDRYNVPVIRKLEWLVEEVNSCLQDWSDGKEYKGPEEHRIYHPLKLTTN